MEESGADKAYFIKAYFENLQRRIAFLVELNDEGRKDEALMLCCCYIEALGSRVSSEPERKAQNYCRILSEQGGNELWRLVHPIQLKRQLSLKPLFGNVLGALVPVIDEFGMQLIEPDDVIAKLSPLLDKPQCDWLNNNVFKGSVAYISYEEIRSELVHDISGGSISFSQTFYRGNPVPTLGFEILHASLTEIVRVSREKAVSTNKWWYEH